MQLDPPRNVVSPEDDAYLHTDIFSRMSDVELLAELRRIAARARGGRGGADPHTAARATELFASFYAHRTQSRVPHWLFERTRAFVREFAP